MSDAAAVPTAAPATAPTETPAGGPPPEVKADPMAEALAALDKAGGLRVKANGKEHKLTSEQIRRRLEQAMPVEAALENVAKQRQELEPKARLIDQLQNGTPDEQEEALEKLMGSKFLTVAERRLIRQMEQEQKFDGMSERERALAQQLEQERGEKTKLAQEKAAFEKAQRDAEESAEVARYQQQIGEVCVAALKQLELPDKMEPMALRLIKPILHELMAQGQMPTPDFLASRIDEVLTGLVEWRFSGARSETALKRFAPALREYSAAQLKAIQASRQNQPSAPPPSSDKPGDGVGKMVSAWDPRKLR